MKKNLYKSIFIASALAFAAHADAQDIIPLDIYGFMTKTDVSFNAPQSQQYVVSRLIYTTDSTSPYYLQKQTSAFDSKVEVNGQWVEVASCFVRKGEMYVVRQDSNFDVNQISTYDGFGKETVVANVPTDHGYILHSAYVEQEDMVYMVLTSPLSSTADLYKAPGDNLTELTFVANISNTFMGKPFSFTYAPELDLFFYVTNSALLYSVDRNGVKDYYYEIHPDTPFMPSDGSNDSEARFIDITSGLIWANDYDMLVWVCPRGAAEGGALTYWYGLEPVKNSEYAVVHRLLNHVDSGVNKNYYNCMTTQGINMTQGLPPAPTYVSVYTVNGKPGYYDISWPVVKNDVDGNPIEGEIYYNVYIGDRQIAMKKQPAKGITVGARILLPQEYTADTFFVGVETVTEFGKSSMKVEGPIKSTWDPDDPGSWYDTSSVSDVTTSGLDVNVTGNTVSISGLEGDTANIISIDGRVVNTLTGDAAVELQPGLYIVATASETFKILVK